MVLSQKQYKKVAYILLWNSLNICPPSLLLNMYTYMYDLSENLNVYSKATLYMYTCTGIPLSLTLYASP